MENLFYYQQPVFDMYFNILSDTELATFQYKLSNTTSLLIPDLPYNTCYTHYLYNTNTTRTNNRSNDINSSINTLNESYISEVYRYRHDYILYYLQSFYSYIKANHNKHNRLISIPKRKKLQTTDNLSSSVLIVLLQSLISQPNTNIPVSLLYNLLFYNSKSNLFYLKNESCAIINILYEMLDSKATELSLGSKFGLKLSISINSTLLSHIFKTLLPLLTNTNIDNEFFYDFFNKSKFLLHDLYNYVISLNRISTLTDKYLVNHYNVYNINSNENCICSDGIYIYIYNVTGLYKVGTGIFSTIPGRIYLFKSTIKCFRNDDFVFEFGNICYYNNYIYFRAINCQHDIFADAIHSNNFENNKIINFANDSNFTPSNYYYFFNVYDLFYLFYYNVNNFELHEYKLIQNCINEETASLNRIVNLSQAYFIMPLKNKLDFNYNSKNRNNIFYRGMLLDCKDSVGNWIASNIIDINSNHILIHYINWSSKWNEWIEKTSSRLAPYGTYTKIHNNTNSKKYNIVWKYETTNEVYVNLPFKINNFIEKEYQSQFDYKNVRKNEILLPFFDNTNYLLSLNTMTMINTNNNLVYNVKRVQNDPFSLINMLSLDNLFFTCTSKRLIIFYNTNNVFKNNNFNITPHFSYFDIKTGDFLGRVDCEFSLNSNISFTYDYMNDYIDLFKSYKSYGMVERYINNDCNLLSGSSSYSKLLNVITKSSDDEINDNLLVSTFNSISPNLLFPTLIFELISSSYPAISYSVIDKFDLQDNIFSIDNDNIDLFRDINTILSFLLNSLQENNNHYESFILTLSCFVSILKILQILMTDTTLCIFSERNKDVLNRLRDLLFLICGLYITDNQQKKLDRTSQIVIIIRTAHSILILHSSFFYPEPIDRYDFIMYSLEHYNSHYLTTGDYNNLLSSSISPKISKEILSYVGFLNFSLFISFLIEDSAFLSSLFLNPNNYILNILTKLLNISTRESLYQIDHSICDEHLHSIHSASNLLFSFQKFLFARHLNSEKRQDELTTNYLMLLFEKSTTLLEALKTMCEPDSRLNLDNVFLNSILNQHLPSALNFFQSLQVDSAKFHSSLFILFKALSSLCELNQSFYNNMNIYNLLKNHSTVSVKEIETSHPYSPGIIDKTVSIPLASYITLEFDQRCSSRSSNDSLLITTSDSFSSTVLTASGFDVISTWPKNIIKLNSNTIKLYWSAEKDDKKESKKHWGWRVVIKGYIPNQIKCHYLVELHLLLAHTISLTVGQYANSPVINISSDSSTYLKEANNHTILSKLDLSILMNGINTDIKSDEPKGAQLLTSSNEHIILSNLLNHNSQSNIYKLVSYMINHFVHIHVTKNNKKLNDSFEYSLIAILLKHSGLLVYAEILSNRLYSVENPTMSISQMINNDTNNNESTITNLVIYNKLKIAFHTLNNIITKFLLYTQLWKRYVNILNSAAICSEFDEKKHQTGISSELNEAIKDILKDLPFNLLTEICGMFHILPQKPYDFNTIISILLSKILSDSYLGGNIPTYALSVYRGPDINKIETVFDKLRQINIINTNFDKGKLSSLFEELSTTSHFDIYLQIVYFLLLFRPSHFYSILNDSYYETDQLELNVLFQNTSPVRISNENISKRLTNISHFFAYSFADLSLLSSIYNSILSSKCLALDRISSYNLLSNALKATNYSIVQYTLLESLHQTHYLDSIKGIPSHLTSSLQKSYFDFLNSLIDVIAANRSINIQDGTQLALNIMESNYFDNIYLYEHLFLRLQLPYLLIDGKYLNDLNFFAFILRMLTSYDEFNVKKLNPKEMCSIYLSEDNQFVNMPIFHCKKCGFTDDNCVCLYCKLNCHNHHECSLDEAGTTNFAFCDCGNSPICKSNFASLFSYFNKLVYYCISSSNISFSFLFNFLEKNNLVEMRSKILSLLFDHTVMELSKHVSSFHESVLFSSELTEFVDHIVASISCTKDSPVNKYFDNSCNLIELLQLIIDLKNFVSITSDNFVYIMHLIILAFKVINSKGISLIIKRLSFSLIWIFLPLLNESRYKEYSNNEKISFDFPSKLLENLFKLIPFYLFRGFTYSGLADVFKKVDSDNEIQSNTEYKLLLHISDNIFQQVNKFVENFSEVIKHTNSQIIMDEWRDELKHQLESSGKSIIYSGNYEECKTLGTRVASSGFVLSLNSSKSQNIFILNNSMHSLNPFFYHNSSNTNLLVYDIVHMLRDISHFDYYLTILKNLFSHFSLSNVFRAVDEIIFDSASSLSIGILVMICGIDNNLFYSGKRIKFKHSKTGTILSREKNIVHFDNEIFNTILPNFNNISSFIDPIKQSELETLIDDSFMKRLLEFVSIVLKFHMTETASLSLNNLKSVRYKYQQHVIHVLITHSLFLCSDIPKLSLQIMISPLFSLLYEFATTQNFNRCSNISQLIQTYYWLLFKLIDLCNFLPQNYINRMHESKIEENENSMLIHLPFLENIRQHSHIHLPTHFDLSSCKGVLIISQKNEIMLMKKQTYKLKHSNEFPLTIVANHFIASSFSPMVPFFYFEIKIISLPKNGISIGICSHPLKTSNGFPDGGLYFSSNGKKSQFYKRAKNVHRELLEVGDYLDVLDNVNKWEAAVVTDIKSSEVYIHYINWDTRYDEWVQIGGNRIENFRSHTAGSLGQLFSSDYTSVKFQNGDNIGVLYNLQNLTLSFTRNGVDLGIAFTSLNNNNIVPSIIFTAAPANIQYNFGASHFRFNIGSIQYELASPNTDFTPKLSSLTSIERTALAEHIYNSGLIPPTYNNIDRIYQLLLLNNDDPEEVVLNVMNELSNPSSNSTANFSPKVTALSNENISNIPSLQLEDGYHFPESQSADRLTGNNLRAPRLGIISTTEPNLAQLMQNLVQLQGDLPRERSLLDFFHNLNLDSVASSLVLITDLDPNHSLSSKPRCKINQLFIGQHVKVVNDAKKRILNMVTNTIASDESCPIWFSEMNDIIDKTGIVRIINPDNDLVLTQFNDIDRSFFSLWWVPVSVLIPIETGGFETNDSTTIQFFNNSTAVLALLTSLSPSLIRQFSADILCNILKHSFPSFQVKSSLDISTNMALFLCERLGFEDFYNTYETLKIKTQIEKSLNINDIDDVHTNNTISKFNPFLRDLISVSPSIFLQSIEHAIRSFMSGSITVELTRADISTKHSLTQLLRLQDCSTCIINFDTRSRLEKGATLYVYSDNTYSHLLFNSSISRFHSVISPSNTVCIRLVLNNTTSSKTFKNDFFIKIIISPIPTRIIMARWLVQLFIESSIPSSNFLETKHNLLSDVGDKTLLHIPSIFKSLTSLLSIKILPPLIRIEVIKLMTQVLNVVPKLNNSDLLPFYSLQTEMNMNFIHQNTSLHSLILQVLAEFMVALRFHIDPSSITHKEESKDRNVNMSMFRRGNLFLTNLMRQQEEDTNDLLEDEDGTEISIPDLQLIDDEQQTISNYYHRHHRSSIPVNISNTSNNQKNWLYKWANWHTKLLSVVTNLRAILSLGRSNWEFFDELSTIIEREENKYTFDHSIRKCLPFTFYVQLTQYLIFIADEHKVSPIHVSSDQLFLNNDSFISQFPLLSSLHKFSLLKLHIFYLQNLNLLISDTLDLVPIYYYPPSYSLHDLLISCRALIFPQVLNSYIKYVLLNTCTDVDNEELRPSLKIDRIAATIAYEKAVNYVKNDPSSALNISLIAQDTIIHQVMQQLESIPFSLFRSPAPKGSTPHVAFDISYVNESAVGTAGPYRAFFNDFCFELQQMKTLTDVVAIPLFIPVSNYYLPNPKCVSPIHLEMYQFIGMIIAIAMRTRLLLTLDFSPIVWKLLCNETLELNDLMVVDPQFVETTINPMLRCNDAIDYNKQFGPHLTYGTLLKFDSTPINIEGYSAPSPVTFDERFYFVKLYKELRAQEFSLQINALREGMQRLIPRAIFTLVTGSVLEYFICGKKEIDLELLKRHTEYSNGFDANSPHIQYFWNVLETFSQDQLMKLIQFIYGIGRLPSTDEEFNNFPKTRMLVKTLSSTNPDMMYPRAETCFFALVLPKYSSENIMRSRLLDALNFDSGVSMSGDDFNELIGFHSLS